jgi:hypothetical protein
LDPCPKAPQRDFLRAQAIISGVLLSAFPFAAASRHAAASGELHQCMARAKLNALTFTAKRRPYRPAVPPVRTAALVRQQLQQDCRQLKLKFARFMAVRRRRPLIPPRYPRRNRYAPVSVKNGLEAKNQTSPVRRLSAGGRCSSPCHLVFTGAG